MAEPLTPPTRATLDLDRESRRALWAQVSDAIEHYFQDAEHLRVAPVLDPARLTEEIARIDLSSPLPASEAVASAIAGLTEHQVHTPHPMYFGLFNPAPTAASVAADALVAAFNPQLAAWSHSPFAAEIERRLVVELGRLFGYPAESIDGTPTTGGAEANHTALLCALRHRYPEIVRGGVRALAAAPVLYASTESHHSVIKAARASGLGDDSVRLIGVDRSLRLDVDRLSETIRADRRQGRDPFLVVATAGTTSAGAIDPLPETAVIAREAELWLHVDAAWGGAAMAAPEKREILRGIDEADSVTVDAHKWFSVPMAAGYFVTRHREILAKTFGLSAAYMPRDAQGFDVVDPYSHSIQWSRRFAGLKLWLSLQVAGWSGYAEAVRHQFAMGDLARRLLSERGWTIVNESPLPLVCFADEAADNGDEFVAGVVAELLATGRAWMSTVRLGAGAAPAIRMCITNYKTQPRHVEEAVDLLEGIRRRRAIQFRG